MISYKVCLYDCVSYVYVFVYTVCLDDCVNYICAILYTVCLDDCFMFFKISFKICLYDCGSYVYVIVDYVCVIVYTCNPKCTQVFQIKFACIIICMQVLHYSPLEMRA